METLKKKYFLYTLPIYGFLGLIILVALIAPYLESRRLAASEVFYLILRPLCHQMPTRCLWMFGSNTALCSRCMGIYIAILLSGLYLGVKAPSRIYWKTPIVLILPVLIDGLSQYIGWRMSNNYLRFSTGLIAGTGAGMFFFPIYFRLVDGLTLNRRKKA